MREALLVAFYAAVMFTIVAMAFISQALFAELMLITGFVAVAVFTALLYYCTEEDPKLNRGSTRDELPSWDDMGPLVRRACTQYLAGHWSTEEFLDELDSERVELSIPDVPALSRWPVLHDR